MNIQQAAFRNHSGLRLVKRLPANRYGRDFIVGDLHGCKKDLDRLLQLVKFDSSVDRLISVGDLVDRGQSSLECLLLLKSPWFHAVMGNHEQLLLSFFRSWMTEGSSPDPYSEAGISFLVNGGSWALHECDSNTRPLQPLNGLLSLAAALPQILVVGEGVERYNVVHAELTKAGKKSGETAVWTDAEIDALGEYGSNEEDYPAFRWSRQIMGSTRWNTRMPSTAVGLSPTFCGHSVGFGIRKAYSHICLDTGAFIGYRDDPQADSYGLTMIDIKDRHWYMVRGLFLADGDL